MGKRIQEREALAPRLLLLLLLLGVEKVFILNLPPSWMANWHLWLGATPLVFVAALLFFGRHQLRSISAQNVPINYPSLAAHLVGLAALAFLQVHFGARGYDRQTFEYRVAASIWTALLPFLVVTLVTTLLPLSQLLHTGRRLGVAWAYAAACTISLIVLRRIAYASWDESSSSVLTFLQNASFHQTSAILRRFYPLVLSDPTRHLLGTPNFLVEVSWLCSGIEGLALSGILTIRWIFFVRSDRRVARALLILPAALCLTWILNIARLALLISIGAAGYKSIAGRGFHAQAGWIASNVVSLGSLFFIQHVQWFRKAQQPDPGAILQNADLSNCTLVYVLPFASIVAASLVSQAVSGGFEWLYPLRFAAALVVFWWLRREYRAIDLRSSMLGPLAGLLVAGFWFLWHRKLHLSAGDLSGTSQALAQMSPLARAGWVSIRVLAAVVTVPIAEELAFRGFLARRVMDAAFETVPYPQLNAVALAVSSLAFGVMHGRMWAAGTLAGLVFGLLARRTGRLGEAISAHVTANLILAILAVWRSDYTLW